VLDLLDGEGDHEMCVSWPIHPTLDACAVGDGHLVTRNAEEEVLQIVYASESNISLGQVRGDAHTNLGWWSDRLEARTPSWLLTATCRGGVPLAMVTMLVPLGEQVTPITNLELSAAGSCLVVAWQVDGQRRECCIDRASSGAIRHNWTPAAEAR
jgi:hypothetical protein